MDPMQAPEDITIEMFQTLHDVDFQLNFAIPPKIATLILCLSDRANLLRWTRF